MSVAPLERVRSTAVSALAVAADSFAAERERWALWAPVFLGSGIVGYFALTFEPAGWVAPLILFCAVLVVLLRPRGDGLVVAALMTAAIALGFCAAQYSTHAVGAPVLAKPYGPANVTGRVIGVEAFAKKPRVLLDQLSLRGLSAAQTPARVWIRLRGMDLPAVGSRIAVFAKLLPPSGPAAPGAYNFRRHAWFARIGAYGYAFGKVRVAAATPDSGKIGIWISTVRQRIAARIRAASPGPSGAVVVILLIAPQSLLGPSFQMSFAAVVALIAVYEQGWRPLGGWFAGGAGRRVGFYIGGVALTTIIAGAATGLFAMYHFGRIANFGLAANLIAVPLTALWIMPWAVVSMALMPFGLEALGLAPMSWGLDIVIGVARHVAAWPGAVGLVPAMPTGGLAALAIGGLWLCIWRRRWRYFGVLGIAAGLVSVPLAETPDILVSGDGRLMAVRMSDGTLALSSTRRAKRVARIWLTRAGQRDAFELRAGPGIVGCDGLDCILRLNDAVVALVNDARALPEDCRRADIVISAVPVRGRCRAARLVVDRFDLLT